MQHSYRLYYKVDRCQEISISRWYIDVIHRVYHGFVSHRGVMVTGGAGVG